MYSWKLQKFLLGSLAFFGTDGIAVQKNQQKKVANVLSMIGEIYYTPLIDLHALGAFRLLERRKALWSFGGFGSLNNIAHHVIVKSLTCRKMQKKGLGVMSLLCHCQSLGPVVSR